MTTPEPFPHLDMREANAQCRPWDEKKAKKDTCPVCHMQVIIHCPECMIQVTGCLCVLEENYGPEIARQKLIDQGVWMPEWGEPPQQRQGLLGPDGRPIDPDRLH